MRQVRPKRSLQAFEFHVEQMETRLLLTSVTVSNATDLVNASDTSSIAALLADDGGDGISLREAILATNAETGNDDIQFDNGLAGQTITLAGTQLEVTDTLEIIGPATPVMIDANQASRAFAFTASTGNLTLQKLTIQNGSVAATGGGIHFESSGTLSVVQSQVLNNRTTAFGQHGGGIYVDNGTLNIADSVISGNTAGGTANGGGIFSNTGDVTVTRSTVSDNLANSYGDGGGLFADSGTLTITASTFARNKAYGGGGIAAKTATVAITNSTLSGNIVERSFSRGAGIYMGSGALGLYNSTVTNNQGLNISNSRGAGIFTDGDLTVENSIVAGNVAPVSTDLRLNPTATLTFSFSLIGSNQGTDLVEAQTADANGNLIGGSGASIIDPRLTTLANFGGPTETQALLVTSPAINAGDNLFDDGPLPHDQRGAGFDRIVDGRLDMGATEGTPTGVVDGGHTIFIFGDPVEDDRLNFRRTPTNVRVTLNGERTDLTGTTATRLEVHASGGNDRVTINTREAMAVHILGDSGHDVIRVRNDGETTAHGGEGDDNIRTGNGNDLLFGDAGNDRLNGARGDDIIRGGDDQDQLRGAVGNDVLAGNAGDDNLVGGGDRDLLIGGTGVDQLNGSGGDDILIGADLDQQQDDDRLRQIIDVWTMDTDVQSRINIMQGAVATVISTIAVPNIGRPQTVFDDFVADTLRTGRSDWTFQQTDDVVQGTSDFLNGDVV